MGRFSNYIDNLNRQTEILRKSVTAASGVNCSNYSIMNCAQIIDSSVQFDTEDNTDFKAYTRPEYVPDMKEILNSAPIIDNGTTKYYPAYIVLLKAFDDSNTFYKNKSNTSTAPNYLLYVGVNAILFSDRCDDILSASFDELEVGDVIEHHWDKTKDIKSPNKDDFGYRWFIGYSSVLYSNKARIEALSLYNNLPIIELIMGNCYVSSTLMQTGSGNAGYTQWVESSTLEYVEIQESSLLSGSTMGSSNCFRNLHNLKSFIIDCTFDFDGFGWFGNCTSLQELRIRKLRYFERAYDFSYNEFNLSGLHSLKVLELKTINSSGIFKPWLDYLGLTSFNIPECAQFGGMRYWYFLNSLKIPNSMTTLDNYFCYGMPALKSIILPAALKTIKNNCIYQCGIKSLALPASMESIGTNFCNDCYLLEELVMPTEINIMPVGGICKGCDNLKYVKLPIFNTVSGTPSADFFPSVSYIELYDNFNHSGLNFKGKVLKTVQWFKDVCHWLQDRTSEASGTMIWGEANIIIAKNIWLTFNPNDKRDITWVDEGTEGAINIVQFITEQLNWTLS